MLRLPIFLMSRKEEDLAKLLAVRSRIGTINEDSGHITHQSDQLSCQK